MAAMDPIRHPGNQGLFRALELSVLSTLVGLPLHVHAEGLRGTGKTTIIRSLRRRLPRIERVKGCIYNCRPEAPHCPLHLGLEAREITGLGTEWVAMPFREISHSAKIGTVAGSIDLSRLTDPARPEAALLPGTIPQAHRGIIFVDEVNRLADTAPELADIFLDVMGTKPGQLQVEETGLPGVDLPVSVSIWAASNPDEDPGPLGDIRKQLSDRFDFLIAMERPTALTTVRDILRASRERQMVMTLTPRPPARCGGAPEGGCAVEVGCAAECGDSAQVGEAEVRMAPAAAASSGGPDWMAFGEALRKVQVPAQVEDLVASLYVDFGLESLRGIEAIQHGARMNCVLEHRSMVSLADVTAVAPGALQHRLDVSTFARVMDYLAEKARSGHDGEDEAPPGESCGKADRQPETAARVPAGAGETAAASEAPAVVGSAAKPGEDRSGESLADGGNRRDQAAKGGWSLFRSLFGGSRGRAVGTPGSTGSGVSSGLSSRPGRGAPGSSTGSQDGLSPGSGGSGGGGQGPSRAIGDEKPVAPLHAARPLSEILRDMEMTGVIPPGPRLS